MQCAAALLALRSKVFSYEWVAQIAREAFSCEEPLHEPLVVQWNTPVIGLVPSSCGFHSIFSRLDPAIQRRAVPFRIKCPVPLFSRPVEELAADALTNLVFEIPAFCAKAVAAYNALLILSQRDVRVFRRIRDEAQDVVH